MKINIQAVLSATRGERENMWTAIFTYEDGKKFGVCRENLAELYVAIEYRLTSDLIRIEIGRVGNV